MKYQNRDDTYVVSESIVAIEKNIIKNNQEDLVEIANEFQKRVKKSKSNGFGDLNLKLVNKLGRKSFYKIFIRMYERFFDDPIMEQLLTESKDEISPDTHGRLIGSFILAHFSDDETYHTLRLEKKGRGLQRAHLVAKHSEKRPKNERGKGFTVLQSQHWVGNLYFACLDLKIPSQFRDKIVLALAKK